MALLFRRPFCETGYILIESAATAEMKVHFGDLIVQVLEIRIHLKKFAGLSDLT